MNKTIVSILLLYTLNILSTYGYNITFGPKNNFFTNESVSNPYSNYLRNQSNATLLICYEDFDLLPGQRSGDCELVALDIANQKISTSSVFQFDSLSADNYEVQLFGPNGPLNNFLVGYTNGGDSSTGPGKVVVGSFDVASMTIKYGEPVTFNVGDNDQSNIVELERNDSYFVVCFSVGNNDQKGTGCRVGQYDTTSLTVKFGANMFSVPANGPTDGMGIARVNNGTILVCYEEQAGKGQGVCSIGIIDDLASNGINAQIKFQNSVVFNAEGGTDNIKIGRIYTGNQTDNPDFVICYVSANDGACSYLVVDIDGPNDIDLQFKSRTTFAPRDSVDQPSIQRIPANVTSLDNTNQLLMVCYVDLALIAETAQCVFGEIDITNTMVKFDANAKPSVFEDGKADRIDAQYLGDNNMVVCYVDITDPVQNRAPCLFGTINNNQ